MSCIFACSYVALWEGKYHNCCIGKTVPGGIYFTVNSLTTVGYLLEVFIRLWIPSMVRIFTSAWT